MPITHEVDHARQRILAVMTGDMRLEETVAFATDLAQRGLFAYAQRLDAREATILLTAEDTRRFVTLIARLRQEHGPARIALVTDADASFGMARMYASLAAESDSGFMVCRTMADGDAWLGWTADTSTQAISRSGTKGG